MSGTDENAPSVDVVKQSQNPSADPSHANDVVHVDRPTGDDAANHETTAEPPADTDEGGSASSDT